MIGHGVVVYVDDIAVYGTTKEQVVERFLRVLEILKKHSLYLKPSKCFFFTEEINFLGYVVSKDGIAMQNSKVDAIKTWPPPRNVKEVQRFLGFANFYRRFIPNFAKICKPLTELTKKTVEWKWGSEESEAFNGLKTLFTQEPVLKHFDPTRKIYMETDASDFAIAAVVSQQVPVVEDGVEKLVLHPVGFFSRRMKPAEINYTVHDKELLAIMEGFLQWNFQIRDNEHPIEVITDHRNLEYFLEKKQLNRRQARWCETLSDYWFRIRYRPGEKGNKPDALSRRADLHPGKGASMMRGENPGNFTSLLQHEHFGEDLKDEDPHELFDRIPQNSTQESNQPVRLRAARTEEETLEDKLRKGIWEDESVRPLVEKGLRLVRLSAGETPPTEEPDIGWTENGLLLHRRKFVVPNQHDARLQVLQNRHDSPVAGHPGEHKTWELVSRDYFWPGMNKDIEDFLRTCNDCQRNKTRRHKPYGMLKSLPIPEKPWSDITMDLIEGLPESEGHDSILVVVDRLTKTVVYSPTSRKMTAKDLATIFIKDVFSKHGIPRTIVSDRGSEFTSQFWREFTALLGIDSRFSTAFHPTTDGQTEHVNQDLEHYLRQMVCYAQDNWVSLLPMAEFVHNNTKHSSIGMTPFFADHGYHPTFDINVPATVATSPAGHDRAKDLEEVHEYLRKSIQNAQERAAKYFDKKHMDPPEIKVGGEVFLNGKNITMYRPSGKLDCKYYGPFKVKEQISSHAFRLELPDKMRIHNVFHVDMLEKAPAASDIPNRKVAPPGPVETDNGEEYHVEEIVDMRKRGRSLQYLVRWKGYQDAADYETWAKPADLKNAQEELNNFLEKLKKAPQRKAGKARRRKK
jgi:transposase InsO family protein